MAENTSAGAMPVVADATSAQSYPSGPVFAAYRLPFPGAPGAREAGVCFDGEAGDGSDSSSGGTGTGAADKGGTTNSDAGSSATDDATLGDAGKRALDAERAAAKAASKRADAAEKALETLKLAGASDSDKAIAAARKEGADEVTERSNAKVRRSEVRAALATAGINASVLDLATKADEFAALKVTDDGDVEGLAEAIKAFKAGKPDLFKATVTPGAADGGARGTKTITRDQLKTMTPEEINKAFDAGDLAGVLTPPGR